MSLFKIWEPAECESGYACKHSITTAGVSNARCCDCRLAPDNDNVTTVKWSPLKPSWTHPVLNQEKRNVSRSKATQRQKKRLGVDRQKRSVLKNAVRAEKKTNKSSLIVATKNSGRSNRDGDHVAGGFITVDTKNQSGNEHPVVRLAELAKVRQDAKNAGNSYGALLLRNKHGVGVVVLTEDDFNAVLGHLIKE